MIELGRQECLRLLQSSDVGRVVYTDGALPAVTPVNYALDGDRVILRTPSDSQLACKVPGTVVAFEVDELEPGARSGWSVVACGHGQLISDPERLARVAELPLLPWVSGTTPVVVEIVVALLTGRRIVPQDSDSTSAVDHEVAVKDA